MSTTYDSRRVLSHSAGAMIYIANTQAAGPETMAMCMAAYSRTHMSIMERMPELFEIQSAEETEKAERLHKALQLFYIQYGHNSIGDCGNLAIFFEGVSILTAKALEDSALFRGQETSTRYIDFSTGKIDFATDGRPYEDQIQPLAKRWVDLYSRWSAPILAGIEKETSAGFVNDEQRDRTWANACKAKCFDITRAFLPAAARTNVAWSGTIREVRDHLFWMAEHPVTDVRELAVAVYANLVELYPSSFAKDALDSNRKRRFSKESYYAIDNDGYVPGFESKVDFVDIAYHSGEAFVGLLAECELRSRGQLFSRKLDAAASVESNIQLDFGSFRDIQRHRSLIIPNPSLVPSMLLQRDNLQPDLLPINHWYITQALKYIDLIGANRDEFLDELSKLCVDIIQLTEEAFHEAMVEATDDQKGTIEPAHSLANFQNCAPLGIMVPIKVIGPLTKMIYTLELRSSGTVHYTLQSIICDWANMIESQVRSDMQTDEQESVAPALDRADHYASVEIFKLAEERDSFLHRGTQTFKNS